MRRIEISVSECVATRGFLDNAGRVNRFRWSLDPATLVEPGRGEWREERVGGGGGGGF